MFDQQIRGPSPIQCFGHLDHIRGPLPPPGHLVTMKTPFYRGSRSPLKLFPLNGQRRWSETAAVQSGAEEAENQARRWSMPWEKEKTEKQQARMPISKLAAATGAISKPSCVSTPDSSVDGLTEAIRLLSCKPMIKTVQPPIQQPQPPFMDELTAPPQFLPQQGLYGIWSPRTQPNFMKFMRDPDKTFDEHAPP